MQKTLTQTQFQSYFSELEANGFTTSNVGTFGPSGESGTVTGSGVVITYNFDGSTLTLTGVSKPFFVSWAYVWNLVNEHLS